MANSDNKSSQFASVFGFLMTAIGFAVGLGAIWRFPYMIGANGGGAFLVVMILMSLVIAIPLDLCELTLGRAIKKTPIVGMQALAGKKTKWAVIGWVGAAAAILLMSYYGMITGTVLHYVFLTASDSFQGLKSADMARIYNALMENTWLVLVYNAVLLGACATIISKGVSGGLEKFSKVALPLLFVCMVVLAVKSLTLPAAGKAVKWFLTPDVSKITPALLLDCLSQTLFLGGIGLASLFCFGSYLSKDVDLVRSSAVIVLSNMVIAVLAGLIIFPAVFSFGLDPSSGSSLVFQTMPLLFDNMSGGRFFGTLFFLCLLVAAFSTCLGLIEGATATFSDALGISRPKMAWIVCAITFVLGLIPVLCYTPVLASVKIFGKDPYTMLDFVTTYLLIPIGGFMTTVYCCWFWGYKKFTDNANEGAKAVTLGDGMKWLFLYICPVIIVIVLVMGIKANFF